MNDATSSTPTKIRRADLGPNVIYAQARHLLVMNTDEHLARIPEAANLTQRHELVSLFEQLDPARQDVLLAEATALNEAQAADA